MTTMVKNCENYQNCDGSGSLELGSTTSAHCLMIKTFSYQKFEQQKRKKKKTKNKNEKRDINNLLTQIKRFHSKTSRESKNVNYRDGFKGLINQLQKILCFVDFLYIFGPTWESFTGQVFMCLPSSELKLLKDSSRRR